MDYGEEQTYKNLKWTALHFYRLKVFSWPIQKSWSAWTESITIKNSFHSIQSKMGQSCCVPLIMIILNWKLAYELESTLKIIMISNSSPIFIQLIHLFWSYLIYLISFFLSIFRIVWMNTFHSFLRFVQKAIIFFNLRRSHCWIL